jgi:putative membrane protein
MITAKKFLSKEQLNRIEQSIHDAEKLTQAELVGAVATESGRYDRSESIFGLYTAVVFLGIAELLRTIFFARGSWDIGAGLPFSWQAPLVVIGFIVGSLIATYIHPVRSCFISKREMDEEVKKAASHVFAEAKVSSTEKRTGILVYVSLFERKVMILADNAAMKIVGQEGIDKLRDIAVKHLKQNEREKTFTSTFMEAANMLKDKLPSGEINPNELSNQILTYHPRP